MQIIKQLAELANQLDKKGLIEEANIIDKIIKAQQQIEQIPTDSYEPPMSLLQQRFPFDGQSAIFILSHSEEPILFASNMPFTLEQAMAILGK